MDNKFTNIKERVLYLVKYKGIALETFFTNIGMTYGSFKGSAKSRPLNSDAIVNILSTFKDLNPDWLLTGNGEMLKSNNNVIINTVEEPPPSYGKTDSELIEMKYKVKNLIEQLEDQKKECNELREELGKYKYLLSATKKHLSG